MPRPEMSQENDLMTVAEASRWASDYLGKNVTPSNIAYLVNYGRIEKRGANGGVLVSRRDLVGYYDDYFN